MNMKHFIATTAMTIGISLSSLADNKANPQIDYKGFLKISKTLQKVRQQRRVSVERFIKMAQEDDTIILDTRSAAAYKTKHIKGAIHLNFSDFTAQKLASVIPSKKTRILIYCNNNFRNGSASLVAKAPPLALNIPTFINLHGYGYTNVYELANAVNEKNTKLEFAGTVTSSVN
jgi:rhodanese-related sulfurtransferase